MATDPDDLDPVFGDLHYSIINGDSSNQFYIEVSTGLIKTRKALDYETKTSYELVVQVCKRKENLTRYYYISFAEMANNNIGNVY